MQLRTVYNTFFYADKTGDKALFSSGVLSMRLCEPSNRVRSTLIIKQPPPPPKKKPTDRATGLDKKCRHFWKSL